MLITLLTSIVKAMILFTGSYSNNQFPAPLSKEEEESYVKLHLVGNKEARDKLIEHNLRLVAHIVKKFETPRDNVDDLISIGTIGLIKGIDSYSTKHGTRLTTYVARCIENEVLMYFRNEKKNSKNVSLNDMVGYDKDGNEVSILDLLKTTNPDFIADIHLQDSIELLKKYLHNLNEIEKEIVIKRYGLYGKEEQTQKEIAKKLNISRSYVSRIEKRAITKILREFIKSKKTI